MTVALELVCAIEHHNVEASSTIVGPHLDRHDIADTRNLLDFLCIVFRQPAGRGAKIDSPEIRSVCDLHRCPWSSGEGLLGSSPRSKTQTSLLQSRLPLKEFVLMPPQGLEYIRNHCDTSNERSKNLPRSRTNCLDAIEATSRS